MPSGNGKSLKAVNGVLQHGDDLGGALFTDDDEQRDGATYTDAARAALKCYFSLPEDR
jgi:hypothetical protein